MQYVKLVVFVPVSHAEKIRQTLAKAGAGRVASGKYDATSFSTKGIGRFRPLAGARPAIGKKGRIQKVPEERIETICRKQDLRRIIKAVKKAHPYEEPAIDVHPLFYPS
jgi:hypothetical protein